jgi:hypothetical protein
VEEPQWIVQLELEQLEGFTRERKRLDAGVAKSPIGYSRCYGSSRRPETWGSIALSPI